MTRRATTFVLVPERGWGLVVVLVSHSWGGYDLLREVFRPGGPS